MDDFKTRLQEERAELYSKLCKLERFLASNKMGNVSTTQNKLLRKQSKIMASYVGVLDERLGLIHG